jgi:uncharacterized protein (TIGR01244 family)
MFRRLSDTMLVADGQLHPADIAEAAALGVRVIVNNRPDGEEPGQPAGEEIEGAARAAGLAYHHIPVAGGIGQDQIETMAAALKQGMALAFCRSGTRSTYLWALAEASRGGNGAELIAQAAAAGYDLTPLHAYLG